MTLQNGYVFGQSVRLYTDTAWLSLPEREVVSFHAKSFVSQSGLFPYAVTTTIISKTTWADFNALMEHFSQTRPHDTPTLLACAAGWAKAIDARGDGAICRLLIGSFDHEIGQPCLHLISTDDMGFVGPCVPHSQTAYISSGITTSAFRDAESRGFTRERMLALIDAQRAEEMQGAGGTGCGYGVGGEAIEITVSRTGTSQSVVRTWPDQIGAPIIPAA